MYKFGILMVVYIAMACAYHTQNLLGLAKIVFAVIGCLVGASALVFAYKMDEKMKRLEKQIKEIDGK